MRLLTSAFCLLMVFGFAKTSEASWSFSVTPESSLAAFDVVIADGDFNSQTFDLVATNIGTVANNFILDTAPDATFVSGSNLIISTGTASNGLQTGVAVGDSVAVGTLTFESIGRTTPFSDNATFDIEFAFLDETTGLGGTPIGVAFDLIVATPEPTTFLMFGVGMVGLCVRRRRR